MIGVRLAGAKRKAGSMRNKAPFYNSPTGMAATSRWLVALGLSASVAVAQSLPDSDFDPAGWDDDVRTMPPAAESRTVPARGLEPGAAELRGRSADGAGKWRLLASSDGSIEAMDLLDSPRSNRAGSDSGEMPKHKGNVVVNQEGSHAVDRWGTDPYSLSAAGIAGDTLTVTVSFGGGCRDHEFTLVLSNAFMMMDPVRLRATLAHDANGDPCEAWLTEVVEFDLAVAKQAHGEGGLEGGVMVLMLSLEDGTELELPYEF